MPKIQLPDVPWRDTVLEFEPRVTRGSSTSQPPPGGGRLAGRMRIGGPICIPITLEWAGDDQELRRMLMAEVQDYRYSLVHLASTFQPQENEIFEKAWIQIQMESVNGENISSPIAWSMIPAKISQPITFSTGVSVGASLKFVHIDGSVEHEIKRDAIFLEALNELRSDPVWEFSRTAKVDLRGSQRLMMLVRSPKAATVRGHLHLRATLKYQFLKVFSYRVLFPDDTENLVFTLP